MPHKYKELLCRLAVKILQRYNQGHSDNLQRFTWIMVDGKYYAIDSLEVVQETGYKRKLMHMILIISFRLTRNKTSFLL